MVSIKLPKTVDEDLNKRLKETLNRLIHEQMGQKNLNYFKDNFESKLKDASSSIRLSISTKNKLKRLMNSSETFDELINRIIDENNEFNKEISNLRKLELENKNLINHFEDLYKRVKRIFSYHPDLKIEYSYNESKIRLDERYSFNLIIDKYIYQGNEISEEDAIRIIQSISIIKDLKKRNRLYDIEKIINEKDKILDNPYEFIKTKYLLYFKILHLIINKKLNSLQDNTFLDINFWKNLYSRKIISKESFNVDVKNKFQKFDAEINQLKVTHERNMWNFKLK